MSVLDAAYFTGQDYPGGAEALAARLARPSLSDELNPNRRNAKLGLGTAVDMQVMSGDYRILYAMAAALRHFPPVPMPDLDERNEPCAIRIAAVAREFGELMQEVVIDVADGEMTDNELQRATQKWSALVAKGQELMQQLGAMNARLHSRAPESAA